MFFLFLRHWILLLGSVCVILLGCANNEDGQATGSNTAKVSPHVDTDTAVQPIPAPIPTPVEPAPTAPPTNSTTERTGELLLQDLTIPAFQSVPGGVVSQEALFTLPVNTVSLIIHLFGPGVDSYDLAFNTLETPQGQDVLQVQRQVQECLKDYCNLLIPKIPNMEPTAGTWKLRLQGDASPENFQIKIGMRTAKEVLQSVLPVQIFHTGSLFKVQDLLLAIERMKQIYAKNGLTLKLDSPIWIDDKQFTTVSEDFGNSRTTQLLLMGKANRINLFLVEDLSGEGSGGSLLGITPLIPGSLGLRGNRNGVLIGLLAHAKGAVLDSSFLGETLAHEMGHWLGLYHPTESNGREFDPLTDTPECPISRAKRGVPREVNAEDCLGFGAENLMFWEGYRAIDQSELSPQQIEILSKSPIGQ